MLFERKCIFIKSKLTSLLHNIKAQWYLMLNKRGFWFSIFVIIFINVLSYIINVYNESGKDVFQMARPTDYFSLVYWSNSVDYVVILFPFLIVFPVAFHSFDEEIGKNSVFGIIRSSFNLYYYSKAIVAFVSGLVIICLPFALNIFWNMLTFCDNMNGHEGMWNSQMYFENTGYAFADLYSLHPFIYEIVFTILTGFFSGICSLFAYSLSIYIKKYKIVCVIPVYLLFFVSRALDLKGIVLDSYISFPLNRSCVPLMFIVEGLMAVISVLMLKLYVSRKEYL